ncbi:PREDICTED: LON peptidase N-terminal domain and RING finger protein 3-like [Tarenaya hassleriana]|uniref:LON peptidase N-terminal domain and RING finger protein 3-like n=1 Tax=Tarenaya hassleriana TaxID=28532 RepID=UPI00053C2D79|nr:PREDICTED: LON peptidase N-terminal domain and RING finger protein 3-like [Tarenaya hassleriana]
MDTQGLRGAGLRRRRKASIDLNVRPNETRDREGTSNSGIARGVSVGNNQGESVPAPPPPIDVDAIDDDDVVESSASAFAEAINKSTGTGLHRRPLMVDVDSGRTSRMPANISIKRRRVPPNQPVIDCDHVVLLTVPGREPVSKPPPPQEEPKFTCPICMCPFTQETSTKCGHIFCKECIKMAISSQGKCPTCRKKVTARDLIRVFLPATTRHG